MIDEIQVKDLALIARLHEVLEGNLAAAVMVGASRKRVVRETCAPATEGELVAGGIALHLVAVAGGAHVLRVHDVAETVAAVRAVVALRKARG